MQRIVYISTTRNILTSTELDEILVKSRRNNRAVGVTGLLISGGRRFLQTLEGPDHAVEAVFRRIEQDPRHFAVVMLSRAPIAERSFGDWAMGHCGGGNTGSSAELADTLAQLLAPIADANTRAYFEGFAQLHAAA